MALNDFFRINFPFGICQYKDNKWYAYNREYLPLGFSTYRIDRSDIDDKFFDQYPLLTEYKSLNDKFCLKIAGSEEFIHRNKDGSIERVFLYNDASNPQSFPELWDIYNQKIKLLSQLIVKR
tara:strand:+ start:195 stop:560 length:366 start_codon:yes stop_codon:yes gene_type:complete